MSIDRLSTAKTGIEQLVNEVQKSLAAVRDPERQIREIAVVINNFVMQTLSVVSDNEDVGEVNKVLADSLVQIKDFAGSRQAQIDQAANNLKSRLDAYEQCLLILKAVEEIEDEPEKVEDEPEKVEAEPEEMSEDKKKE